MLRTIARILDPYSSAEFVNCDVVSSYKLEGVTLLVYRNTAGRHSSIHAPTGINLGFADSDVSRHIELVTNYASHILDAIDSKVREHAEYHIPDFAPEEGIQFYDWKRREQSRFEDGTYRPVPSVCGINYPKEHYLYLSITKEGSDYVAYTPSERHGIEDRQVVMKFGKYLRKTFPEMSDAQVQNAVVALRSKLALQASPAKLHFTTDKEQINEIFETEMFSCDSAYSSCMYNKFRDWKIRPYHVYADSPDVAVAYVTEFGDIVARSVVSTKNKEWVRPYSHKPNDSTYCRMLIDMLDEAGYSEGDLVGSRLTKLNSSKGVILPYIDNGGMSVKYSSDERYWIVCDGGGEYTGDQTDGYASSSDICAECENDSDECQCSYCECCERSYAGGCDECSYCENCDGCTYHDICECERCERCSYVITPNRRYVAACGCERCGECHELEDGCSCERCGECDRVEPDCECEEESDGEDEKSKEATC